MITVLGIDPGAMTGLAIIEVTTEPELSWTVRSFQLEPDEAFVWLYDAIKGGTEFLDVVALERYTITNRTARLSRQMDATDLIGWVKGLTLMTGTELVLQTPADAKAVWPDSRLLENGLKVKGRHARDAMRHAALALLRRGMVLRHGSETPTV